VSHQQQQIGINQSAWHCGFVLSLSILVLESSLSVSSQLNLVSKRLCAKFPDLASEQQSPSVMARRW
jgi:hypothetical protein